MTKAKFIKRIHIGGGDVGHYYVGRQQLLEHLQVNGTRMPYLICPKAAYAFGFYNRFYQRFVRLIKIEFTACSKIGFIPKPITTKQDLSAIGYSFKSLCKCIFCSQTSCIKLQKLKCATQRDDAHCSGAGPTISCPTGDRSAQQIPGSRSTTTVVDIYCRIQLFPVKLPA